MAAAGTTAFDGYLEGFSSARSDALKAIDAYDRCSDRGKREELVVEARSVIEEVERYVRVLENEVENGTSSAAKRKMTEQVLRCKTQCGTLKSNLEKAILTGDAKAKKLGGPSSASNDPKEQAVRVAERIDRHGEFIYRHLQDLFADYHGDVFCCRNGRHIDEAQRTLAETEAIGTIVKCVIKPRMDLVDPNFVAFLHVFSVERDQQPDGAAQPVEQAQEDTEEAKGHIRRLAIKAVTSKLCLIFVMVCLAVAIALVSYYKWYPKNKKDYLGILPNTSAPAASTTGRL